MRMVVVGSSSYWQWWCWRKSVELAQPGVAVEISDAPFKTISPSSCTEYLTKLSGLS